MNYYEHMDDLLNHKYTLQRDILKSWTELQDARQRHDALLNKLQELNNIIKDNAEASLFNQLFNTTTPES